MMEKQTEKKLLIVVAVFYIAVSLLAVCILNLAGSIFAARGEVDLPGYFRSLANGNSELKAAVGEDGSGTGKVVGLEALGSNESMREETAEKYKEDDAGTAAEQVSADAVTVTETPAEEPAPEPEVEVHYYSFKTNNTDSILRMREGPGEEYAVKYELKPGSTGYVIELGDEWSRVMVSGVEGYCSNEYLTMTEITEEAYNELVELESSEAVSPGGAASQSVAQSQSAAAQTSETQASGAGTPAAGSTQTQASQTQTDAPAASGTGQGSVDMTGFLGDPAQGAEAP